LPKQFLDLLILFEFLPPEFESQYLQTMQPEKIAQILGEPIQLSALKHDNMAMPIAMISDIANDVSEEFSS
jgi:hypothetical protein